MMTLPEMAALDRQGLTALWSTLFRGMVPPQMSQPMMRRFLAFEIQSRQQGGLPAALCARLDRIAAGAERKASPAVRPGTRLLRAWNGTTHVVDVLPDGFFWNGKCHRSLSAIARAITGARWSGPRFFGLTAGSGPDQPVATGKVSMRNGSGSPLPAAKRDKQPGTKPGGSHKTQTDAVHCRGRGRQAA